MGAGFVLGAEVVSRVYTAAGARDPARELLAAVAQPLGCEVAALSFVDRQQRALEQSRFIGVAPDIAGSYDHRWLPEERRWCRDGSWLEPGTFAAGGEALRRSRYYRSFLRPLGLWDVARGCVETEVGRTTVVGFWRPRARGVFSDSELELGRELLPHVRRAFELRRKLDIAERRERALVGSLDLLGSAILLIDSDGTMLCANRGGEALLRDRLLVVHNGRIGPGGPHPQLERALTTVLRRLPGADAAPDAIALDHGSHQLVVFVSPLPIQGGSGALILVSDPGATSPLDTTELLRSLWGLTATEARLALALSQRTSLLEVSKALQISYETARTHLRHVFSKTGLHRQGELVRLVLAIPGSVAGRALPTPPT